eukprot:2663453-Prymnesium_polylepis.1
MTVLFSATRGVSWRRENFDVFAVNATFAVHRAVRGAAVRGAEIFWRRHYEVTCEIWRDLNS